MKKIILSSFAVFSILLLSACSTNQALKPESSSSKISQNDNSKYDSVISDLKSELADKSEYKWVFKIEHNITNADISKGVMINIAPEKYDDSKELKNTYIELWLGDKQSKNKIILLQKLVSKAAKKLPDDNSEITLGFKSEQERKGVVPVARSVKSMDAVPIHE